MYCLYLRDEPRYLATQRSNIIIFEDLEEKNISKLYDAEFKIYYRMM